MSKKFFIQNSNVCTRMELHGENVKEVLKQNGWEMVDNREDADYIFFNTCAFIKNVEEETIKRLSEIKEKDKLVIIGCLPEINREELNKLMPFKSYGGYDLNPILKDFGLTDTPRLVGGRLSEETGFSNSLINKANVVLRNSYLTYLYDKKKVYHLWISQGCLGNCTYCADPANKTKLRSHLVADIIENFKDALNKGYKIFSLNADDTSSFGYDNNENLTMLLEQIISVEGDYKIIITECNPVIFSKQPQFKEVLKSSKITLINLPLQSGSKEIINSMGRKYEPEKIVKILEEIKKENSKLMVNTHVIVGFPGECNEDFIQTKKILENFIFNRIKVFKYSERPNTKAILLPNKVDEDVKLDRYKILKRLVLRQTIKSVSLQKYIVNFTRPT